jgi:eukaryotic-like serine/threonine-protein kinase
MSLANFLKSKTFLKHLGLSVLAIIVIAWIASMLLGFLTNHGEEIAVPDFTGIPIEKLDDYVSDYNLEYLITDSVYDVDAKKGTVISQDPYANAKVKSGRTIYLTVVARTPEQVTMPDLKDLTLRQAISMLETYGLKTGKLEYVADIARNAVLRQKYKGSTIESGKMIEKGSTIDLVLGKGAKNENASIPFLLGKNRKEALKLIKEYSLNVGDENFEGGSDTTNARVYRQNPKYSKKGTVPLGTSVDVWYKNEKKFDFKGFLEKHKNDTISEDDDE